MPRDIVEVTAELKKLGWEIPKPLLDDLALNLMPDESVLGAFLGKGKIWEYGGTVSPGYDYRSYDLIMLAATPWRFLMYAIKGGNVWGQTQIFWQYMGFFRFTIEDDSYFIRCGYAFEKANYETPALRVMYSARDVKPERYMEFANVVQRQLQTAKSAL